MSTHTPQGTGWRKVPSVTTGGQPFFWYRRDEQGPQWYAWNRRTQQWEYNR